VRISQPKKAQLEVKLIVTVSALANIRHERFCQLYVKLGNASEAYRQAGFQGKNADVLSAQLLVNPSICNRISEIREEQAAKCEMTKDQFRQFLVSVNLAKPEDASFNNPLCEVAMTKAGPAVVFPSKLAAAAQLAKLTGWNEVEKVSVEAGDTLSAFLRQIVTK
jgi:hypothetical protein